MNIHIELIIFLLRMIRKMEVSDRPLPDFLCLVKNTGSHVSSRNSFWITGRGLIPIYGGRIGYRANPEIGQVMCTISSHEYRQNSHWILKDLLRQMVCSVLKRHPYMNLSEKP